MGREESDHYKSWEGSNGVFPRLLQVLLASDKQAVNIISYTSWQWIGNQELLTDHMQDILVTDISSV
jgi:hypothetical protein